jgi:hypothetical protein
LQLPKCKRCKEDGIKEEMICYPKPLGQFNKNGTEKIRRTYFHKSCDELNKEELQFKEKEAKELDDLYRYLLKLHNVEILDGRMFERLQDLRNGTVKLNGRKIRRSKEGVTHKHMLDTYQHIAKTIDNVFLSKTFETKWNEFAYVFSIMVNNLNEVKLIQKRNAAVKVPKAIESYDYSLEIATNKSIKKDSMDISDFL